MSAQLQPLLAQLAAQVAPIGRAAEASLEGLDETKAARLALSVLAQAGLCAWTVPQAHGGADTAGLAAPDDVSVRVLCALRRALAYHSGMLDVMLVLQGLGSYAIARSGSRELQSEWLPSVARGERVAAFALTEPEAGSDLGGIATRAEKRGASWRLTGAKTFISNCGIADFYTLLARTSGERGDGGNGCLTMFLVPASAPGLSAQRFEVTSPHPIGDLALDGVELDDALRIGAVGEGLELALAVLGRFRTSVAGAATGFARRALDESLAHLRSRQQFGRPLASFQGLRFDVAEMDARLRAAELLVSEAAEAVDRGERAAAEVARAKLFATEVASWLCDRAVQHLGGQGVRRGNPVERAWRGARALRIYEGTSEVQKLILARELLEGPSQD
jgi:acyl-CoA dehydrogenase